MEVEMEDRAEIYADQDLMELVWNNLLSNAVKFTELGGVITVRQLSDEPVSYTHLVSTDESAETKKRRGNRRGNEASEKSWIAGAGR